MLTAVCSFPLTLSSFQKTKLQIEVVGGDISFLRNPSSGKVEKQKGGNSFRVEMKYFVCERVHVVCLCACVCVRVCFEMR